MTIYEIFNFKVPADQLEKLQKIETLLKELDIEYDKKEENTLLNDFGVKIVMNEEKIRNEGIYILKDIYNEIDYLAKKSNMIKVDKYHYVPKNDNHSYCGVFNFCNLKHCDWFMNNVKEWVGIDKEEGNQNLLELVKKYN